MLVAKHRRTCVGVQMLAMGFDPADPFAEGEPRSRRGSGASSAAYGETAVPAQGDEEAGLEADNRLSTRGHGRRSPLQGLHRSPTSSHELAEEDRPSFHPHPARTCSPRPGLPALQDPLLTSSPSSSCLTGVVMIAVSPCFEIAGHGSGWDINPQRLAMAMADPTNVLKPRVSTPTVGIDVKAFTHVPATHDNRPPLILAVATEPSIGTQTCQSAHSHSAASRLLRPTVHGTTAAPPQQQWNDKERSNTTASGISSDTVKCSESFPASPPSPAPRTRHPRRGEIQSRSKLPALSAVFLLQNVLPALTTIPFASPALYPERSSQRAHYESRPASSLPDLLDGRLFGRLFLEPRRFVGRQRAKEENMWGVALNSLHTLEGAPSGTSCRPILLERYCYCSLVDPLPSSELATRPTWEGRVKSSAAGLTTPSRAALGTRWGGREENIWGRVKNSLRRDIGRSSTHTARAALRVGYLREGRYCCCSLVNLFRHCARHPPHILLLGNADSSRVPQDWPLLLDSIITRKMGEGMYCLPAKAETEKHSSPPWSFISSLSFSYSTSLRSPGLAVRTIHLRIADNVFRQTAARETEVFLLQTVELGASSEGGEILQNRAVDVLSSTVAGGREEELSMSGGSELERITLREAIASSSPSTAIQAHRTEQSTFSASAFKPSYFESPLRLAAPIRPLHCLSLAGSDRRTYDVEGKRETGRRDDENVESCGTDKGGFSAESPILSNLAGSEHEMSREALCLEGASWKATSHRFKLIGRSKARSVVQPSYFESPDSQLLYVLSIASALLDPTAEDTTFEADVKREGETTRMSRGNCIEGARS
ncbi:hypothetical protein C8F01DRAFT_1238932 [Mycena amicta]|nr:hypothetical protein C8F01DRAFT_1238932 [Mycena amicta]